MTSEPDRELLEVLECDFAARPVGAPSFDDLARFLRSVRRTPEAVVLTVRPEGAATLRAVVDAEALCCPRLGWQLAGGDRELTVEGSAAQLDALEALLGLGAPGA